MEKLKRVVGVAFVENGKLLIANQIDVTSGNTTITNEGNSGLELANNAKVDKNVLDKYSSEEHKELVTLDRENIVAMNTRLIEDNIFTIEDNVIRHNALKTAYLIFSYLMEGE